MVLKSIGILAFIMLVATMGCSRNWEYTELDMSNASVSNPSASQCKECHEDEYAIWKKTKHSDTKKMQKIPLENIRECGACHDNLMAHIDDAASSTPVAFSEMDKTQQNLTCGKCHYNQEVLGGKAINPHDRHGLFMSVGFQDKKRQLSCLDCHSGHDGKAKMLKGMRAHACFSCHKEAIVTMGVFQPLNYVTLGKTCLACHPAHDGTTVEKTGRMAVGVGLICVVCHIPGHSIAGGDD